MNDCLPAAFELPETHYSFKIYSSSKKDLITWFIYVRDFIQTYNLTALWKAAYTEGKEAVPVGATDVPSAAEFRGGQELQPVRRCWSAPVARHVSTPRCEI